MSTHHKFNRRSLPAFFLLVALLFGTVMPMTAKTLQGSVSEESLRLAPRLGAGVPTVAPPAAGLRIQRNNGALKGNLVDSTAFVAPQVPRTAPMTGVVDTNAFAQPPKTFDIGAERESREMVLAWERWHKQLSQAIYDRWHDTARDPGRATLKVTVTSQHHIFAQIIRPSGNMDFDDCIMAAIASLEGNSGLTFPSKSQRKQVSFEADYIAGAHVKPGFSWVKNDYERVRDN